MQRPPDRPRHLGLAAAATLVLVALYAALGATVWYAVVAAGVFVAYLALERVLLRRSGRRGRGV